MFNYQSSNSFLRKFIYYLKNILNHNLTERRNVLAEGVNTLSALGNKLSNKDLNKLPILSFLLQLKENNFKIKNLDLRNIIT